MLKLFFGMIFFYFCLSNLTIEQSHDIFQINPIIPAIPVKNESWNEYIVLSGNNFINNYYINPIRIKKKE